MKKHHLSVCKISRSDFRRAFGGLNEEREPSAAGMADLRWFSKYKDTYGEELQTLPDFTPNEDVENLRTYFRTVFPPEMQSRIRLVGRGMEKVSFVAGSGVCFKFQYHTMFGEQMKNEIVESKNSPDLHCFPRLFDYSADGMCLACETAEPPTRADFESAFGCSIEQLVQNLNEYAEGGPSDYLDGIMKTQNEEQRRATKDLFDFSRKMFEKVGHSLMDIENLRNWGHTLRNGHGVVLVTDYGL